MARCWALQTLFCRIRKSAIKFCSGGPSSANFSSIRLMSVNLLLSTVAISTFRNSCIFSGFNIICITTPMYGKGIGRWRTYTPRGVLFLPTQGIIYATFALNPFFKGLCQHLEVGPKWQDLGSLPNKQLFVTMATVTLPAVLWFPLNSMKKVMAYFTTL